MTRAVGTAPSCSGAPGESIHKPLSGSPSEVERRMTNQRDLPNR